MPQDTHIMQNRIGTTRRSFFTRSFEIFLFSSCVAVIPIVILFIIASKQGGHYFGVLTYLAVVYVALSTDTYDDIALLRTSSILYRAKIRFFLFKYETSFSWRLSSIGRAQVVQVTRHNIIDRCLKRPPREVYNIVLHPKGRPLNLRYPSDAAKKAALSPFFLLGRSILNREVVQGIADSIPTSSGGAPGMGQV
eukprot:gnl/Dysnectes_brevis/4080_a5350_1229.p1 GENE.gnl/Dysnectes_brevis/4080_a5350_1229~~gnl/Dysnectes_brevis/4080_a5350_1229.p1  ORF type:complete len:194 (+),score=2.30 gnl/Dysnectes_brevis/4080_a5350_1229:64-645(+)